MDNLTITLSSGLSYSFGGSGGNAWAITIPEGKAVRALAGGHGGHLHNFAVYH